MIDAPCAQSLVLIAGWQFNCITYRNRGMGFTRYFLNKNSVEVKEGIAKASDTYSSGALLRNEGW